MGLIVTICGGGPGLIAGSAGVIALPMGGLLAAHGMPYMSAAVILSGLIELFFGAAKLAKVVNVVPEPVVAGFLNAFGVFLVKSQVQIGV